MRCRILGGSSTNVVHYNQACFYTLSPYCYRSYSAKNEAKIFFNDAEMKAKAYVEAAKGESLTCLVIMQSPF
ncbi:hypothetical protein AHF37_08215 [Paragonimus kellicotti]|nr:hypothetical protein AHF37_08215 [Paragonimus kellicotti]